MKPTCFVSRRRSAIRLFKLLIVFIALALLSLLYHHGYSSSSNRRSNVWDFLHVSGSSSSFFGGKDVMHCEELFSTGQKIIDKFQLSEEHRLKSDAFNEKVQELRRVAREPVDEEFSQQGTKQYLAMHYIASQPFVRNICETGFNFGHSSFNWLTASNQTVVHSFDIVNNSYSRTMARFLGQMFPRRIFVHFENSAKIIPLFAKSNPEFRCDVSFVDGGHVYDVASADVKSLSAMARDDGNGIIIFDDYPTDWGNEFGKAWEKAVVTGYLKEKFRCTTKVKTDAKQRGFCVGTVIAE